jgi:ATP-dependent DNA helicase UvrD/PcrA
VWIVSGGYWRLQQYDELLHTAAFHHAPPTVNIYSILKAAISKSSQSLPKATLTVMDIQLNTEQKQAVEYGQLTDTRFSSGPLLILAGAGTGKTNTLAHRTAHLILNGIKPERILLMTFSRRAATELATRAQVIVAKVLKDQQGSEAASAIGWMGTFHSVGNRLLRSYAKHMALDPAFSIMDRADAADMIDMIRHQLAYSSTEKRFPKKSTCLDIYSRCVNAQSPLKEVLNAHFPWCSDWHDELKTLFKTYAKTKVDQIALDYDDLLLYWFHMTQDNTVAAMIRDKFDHVLVDEYQDTNLLQSGILSHLFPSGEGVTVVGDDAQSIYSFRSADVGNILNFPTQYTPPAKVIALSKNYRSTQPILDLSNALLSESDEGYKNTLYSDKPSHQKPRLVSVQDQETQSDYIIDKVLEAREGGTALKNQAVLFRSSHHTDQLEIELRRRDIPYVKHGGLKFLEATHIKDALSILRWADNPKHRISGFRVLKLLTGIGPKTAEKMLDYLELNHFDLTSLQRFQSHLMQSEQWQQLSTLLPNIHNEQIPWTEQMQQLSHWYQTVLIENFSNPFVRAGDIEHLAHISQQFPNREAFLSELTLDPPSKTGDLSKSAHKDDDFLILSTVHSAKGQEWSEVFLMNVADGNFPNEYAVDKPAELEEERRLLNVAITRAKRQVHLIQPLKYWVPEQQKFGGKHVYGAKSRFLTKAVCATLEPIPYPDHRLTEADITAGQAALSEIKDKVIGMWD